MMMRIGFAVALGAGLALAACGQKAAETSADTAATPPEASAGDAMASDAAAPPPAEANGDVPLAPESARPDFGEPGASKTQGKK